MLFAEINKLIVFVFILELADKQPIGTLGPEMPRLDEIELVHHCAALREIDFMLQSRAPRGFRR